MLDEAALVALSALHGLANAECVEAIVSGGSGLAVRSRLAAADRLARCLVALDPILPMLVVPADTPTAALVVRLADAAAGLGPPPKAGEIQARGAALIAAPVGDLKGTEQLAASLRLLRLPDAISDAVATLREVEPVGRPNRGRRRGTLAAGAGWAIRW